MSSRFRIQDATGVIVTTENSQFGHLIMKADKTTDIPSDAGSGYAPGCQLYNLQTGQWYANIGTASSCKFRVVDGYLSTAFTLPSGVAGYALGATLVDPTTGYTYVNIGSDTSCTFVPQTAGTTTGTIWLPIENFRAIASNDIPALAGTPASGILASDTAPKFKRANVATDIALKLEWAATSVIEVQGPSILIPADFDTTKTSTVNVIAGMGGSTDTPTLTVKCFPGVGGSDAGGATGALAAAVATVSVTIAANVFTNLSFANIGITPGAHGTDVARIYGVYVKYTRKAVTA